MSAEDIEYMGNYKEFPTKESALDWLDNYLSLDERNNLIRALEQEPCEDCISRQATIDAIYKKHIGGKDAIENAPINDLYACGLEEAIDAVGNMPFVKPQPKIGQWILADEQNKEDVENDNYRFICSECQCSDIHAKDTIVPYCWKCGTKMVELQESDDKK